MNHEENNFHEEKELIEALHRWEEMAQAGEISYFDVFQFEYIIDSYIDEGLISAAYNVVQTGLEQHPTAFNLKLRKANILFNLGEVQKSLKLTNELLRIEADSPELLVIKGSCHLFMNDPNNASTSFKQALKFSFDDRDEVLYNIGLAYGQSGRYKQALRYLTEAYRLNPLNEANLYELAFCYEKINEDQKSIEFYNKYIDLDTFSDTAWYNLGVVYNKLNKNKKAAEAYEYALLINDDFPSAIFNLGNTYMILREYRKAIESFNDFLEYEDSDDEILCAIGICYSSLKEYTKAKNTLHRAIFFNKSNHRAWFELASIEQKLKNYTTAYNNILKAIDLDQENEEYLLLLATLSEKQYRINDAIDTLDKLCKLFPGNINYWFRYSGFLNRKGFTLKAAEVLENALDHHPDNSDIRYRLISFYLDSEMEKNAMAHLKKALITDYKTHKKILETNPEIIKNKSIQKLIGKFRNQNLS